MKDTTCHNNTGPCVSAADVTAESVAIESRTRYEGGEIVHSIIVEARETRWQREEGTPYNLGLIYKQLFTYRPNGIYWTVIRSTLNS